jgi:hypothetical protein
VIARFPDEDFGWLYRLFELARGFTVKLELSHEFVAARYPDEDFG